jgi:hypothetical protein
VVLAQVLAQVPRRPLQPLVRQLVQVLERALAPPRMHHHHPQRQVQHVVLELKRVLGLGLGLVPQQLVRVLVRVLVLVLVQALAHRDGQFSNNSFRNSSTSIWHSLCTHLDQPT